MLLFEAGALRVMCKHLQLKGNTYYYRRRVPEDVRSLYKRLGKRPEEQLFFSLKTTDKLDVARHEGLQCVTAIVAAEHFPETIVEPEF